MRRPISRSTPLLALTALLVFAHAATADCQEPSAVVRDTLEFQQDTLGLTLAVSQRRTRFLVASGKTYNRVEGLPVHLGPVFSTVAGGFRFNAEVFGIIRSANTFARDAQGLGHLVTGGVRSLSASGAELKLSSYDIVTAVEDWQMPRGEAGLAAFFFRRDYRDHFGRHGASVTASLFNEQQSLDVSLARETWTSLSVGEVLTIFRNNHRWRPNPAVDDGRANVLTARWTVDTRNDARQPATGWLSRLDYEYGDAKLDQLAATSPGVRDTPELTTDYGRVLLDLRRYNRISPASQLNFRLVAGGWLHGGELPLQRRFSVGGPATIPGVRFRDTGLQPDLYTCSSTTVPPGVPAQCERVLLFQTEYREELPFRPGTIFGGTPIRIRSAALTLRPILVAFVDVGRGWLVAEPEETQVTASLDGRATLFPSQPSVVVVPDVSYGRQRIPPLRSFSTDVGLGVDLGLFGAYLAMSVTERGAPLNFIVRARSRF